jgi:hypothetical protein
VATVKLKYSAAAFRSLEAEHADLCRNEHQTTKEAAARAEARIAKVEADIKDISNSVVPGSGERFIRLLRNRFRSSGFSFDYALERNGLLVRLEEISAEKQKHAPEESRRRRAAFLSDRDRQMAEEYRRKRNSPSYKNKSDSDLKADIGKRHRLRSRSASIAAVNRGLKSLGPEFSEKSAAE